MFLSTHYIDRLLQSAKKGPAQASPPLMIRNVKTFRELTQKSENRFSAFASPRN
jgi:hypothetical protein